MVKKGFSNKVIFEQRHGNGEVFGGRIFWLEKTEKASILKRERARPVLERARRPVGLEHCEEEL